jgi:hypothetical protein
MLKAPLPLSFFCIFIAALTLTGAFAFQGSFLGIAVTIVVSAAWGIFIWRKWILGSNLCMLILVLGISLAAFFEGSRLILFTSLLMILAAWDLGAFYMRFSSYQNIADEDQLIRTHLLRLSGVLLLGLVLPFLAFSFQFSLKFWEVFLLGVLLLAGLSLVFAQLKRSSID